MTTPPRFHPPQQSRSQETLHRILDAAESVLDEKSFNEATLAEIVERAGVTVGAFYRRFPDKTALLHHLDERFFDELYVRADELLDPERLSHATTSQIIHEFTGAAVALYRERRGLLRSLFLRSRVDLKVQDTARRVNAHFVERLTAVLLPHRAEMSHPHPAAAIGFGYVVLLGALRESVIFGEVWPDEVRIPDNELAVELARSYLSYLGVKRAKLPTGGE